MPSHPKCLRIAVVAGLAWWSAAAVRAQLDSSPPAEYRDVWIKPYPIFFPPVPPGMGESSPGESLGKGGMASAPEEMSLYVDELFYPILATRLHEDNFSMRLRHPLDHYRIARDNLLVELRAELERTSDFSRDDRLAALEELAKKQAAALAALEHDAEELRQSFAKSAYHWSAIRNWRLGDGTREYSASDEAEVMRAVAFYQDGLSTSQRRLLREAANDVLNDPARTGKKPASPPRDFVVAFLPEGSRIRIPVTDGTPLAAKTEEFKRLKKELKDELRALVLQRDDTIFGFIRTNAYQSLATQQASRIARLERLAEDIRREYDATRPPRPRPPLSPLPPLMTARIAAVLDMRRALQRDTINALNEINPRYPNLPATVVMEFRGTQLVTRIIPYPSANDPESPQGRMLEKYRKEVRVALDSYDDRLDALKKEIESLRADAGAFLNTTDPQKINDALGVVAIYSMAKANEEAYAEYRISTIEPGLSAEQRRLLFGASLGHLDIALPSAEPQPTGRGRR